MPSTTPRTTEAPPIDPQELIEEVKSGLRETAVEIVPWFLEQMPPMYFQDTDHDTQVSHLRAIIAAKASHLPIEINLRSEDGSVWTAMRPMDYPGVLAELVAELPLDLKLRAAKIHTAADGRLVLDTFEFGESEPFDPMDPQMAETLERTVAYAAKEHPNWSPDDIRDFFHCCDAEYVSTVTPLRLASHWKLYKAVSGTDAASVKLDSEADPNQSRITVAVANSSTRTMLERIATRLSHASINIHRAYLDNFEDPGHGFVSLLGFVVQGPDGQAIDPEGELWRQVRGDLLRLKWFDHRSLELAYRHPPMALDRADVLFGLCNLAHQSLLKINPYAFVVDRIIRRCERYIDLSCRIVDLLFDRFDPDGPLSETDFQARTNALHEEIANSVDRESDRITMHKLVEAVGAILRTNLFLESRFAVGFRVDPAFLTTEERPDLPYGVFFVHGRGLNGFHVRFQDIARGGLRVIRTASAEQHGRELERLYDEAYGLAFAQQLKNKDIPEGGSKAAILLDPQVDISRCVKAFVDSILDLITPAPHTRALIVDHFGMQELLYLGPDENITPAHILWIVSRARRRGYPTPNAFMSSKPGAGINHKVYGVTSEGVTVFLDVGLRAQGIDPHNQPFTVKLTGGPDGDVAGNMIKILNREYGDNARIVGIADGSGSAEDPDGLDHASLLKLVEAEAAIADFDRSALGPNGRVTAIDEPDGVPARNTLHNRVVADAFVPSGGRPATIHKGNWRDFLKEDGSPSSPLIVEGANLFLTPEARLELADMGTLIIKDSSANKCGVICSSFEIAASMLLTEEEFLRVKERFVGEVLDRLRTLARMEAELLMSEHKRHPQVPLPEMSTRVSRIINRAASAIDGSLSTIADENLELTRKLVVEHLPPVLVELAGDRIFEVLPASYLNWTIASSLAAGIIYREGVEFLESMPLGAIVDLGMRYLRLHEETTRLVDAVKASDLPDRDRIAKLLARGGTRAGLLELD